MPGLAVEVADLVKVYRSGALEVQALRGLTVSVAVGEMVSIIGPSGSGKSTLLNIVGGLGKATAGRVLVMSEDVTRMGVSALVEFRRTTVGHVFQNANLIPTLTAAENVELPMSALGVGRQDRAKRVAELLAVVGLTGRAGHRPDELSGGEQQRVALAAALSNDPSLVLADEPTGELDTENAMLVADYLRRANRELGKTVIMVTHDPRIARVAGRILRISDGIIASDVAPGEEEGSSGYGEVLRVRIGEVEAELASLDSEFRSGAMGGDAYVERQTRLGRTRDVLRDELHRLGIVH